MGSFFQDLRYAIRMLARRPGFAAVAILTLALGIGANTAIFSVVNGVLLRPAPFEEAERLMMVWETDRNSGTSREPSSVPDYLDFQERSTHLEELAAFTGLEVTLTPGQTDPVRLAAIAVTHEFLPMVGIRPLLGRNFTTEEDHPGGPQVALIGEDLWERLLGRDPAALGRTLRLNDVPRTIIGVLPSAADFSTLQILSAAAYSRAFADRGDRVEVDVWLPLQPNPQTTPRSTHPIFVLGRLASHANRTSAQKEMAAIAADLEKTYPENDARGVFVEPLSDVVFASVRPALWVLLGAVAMVLLIACANVAHLLLARWTARGHEVAVRTALGAGTRRLARQFLVEGLVLTMAGGLIGLLLALWGLDLLLPLAPADIPRISSVGIDRWVLGVTLAISVLVGLAFGIVPALQARRFDLPSALQGQVGRTTSAGRERTRLRSALVVSELALAVVLVAGAGLLIKSFWRLQQVNPGFQAEGVLKMEFQLPPSRYPAGFSTWPNFREIHRFNDALLSRLATLPGVKSAALAGNHPLDAGFTNSFVVVGREAEARNWPEISIRRVTPGYFRTLGVRLIQGRLFQDSDGTLANSVLLINEAAARRFFPNRNPLGQQIAFWGSARTIVGVVGNEKIHGVTEPDPLAVYAPLAQMPSVNGAESLLLLASGDPASMASAVRAAVQELDPALAIFGVEPLDQTLLRSIGKRRFTMLLLGAFAGVALLLGMIGIYGVLSYSVAQRRQEIGIRMALGAERIKIAGGIVRQALGLALLGVTLGAVAAFGLTRVMRSLLFEVSTTDPITFAGVAALLVAVALLAAWLPAHRAASLDPMLTLRHE